MARGDFTGKVIRTLISELDEDGDSVQIYFACEDGRSLEPVSFNVADAGVVAGDTRAQRRAKILTHAAGIRGIATS